VDRQPLIILALGALACDTDDGRRWAFDGPDASVVLPADDASPFDVPVGFVANTRSGTITPLDLKHATLLSDQAASPFLPPRVVATGDERALGQIALRAPGEGVVKVFAADLAFDRLVEASYTVGVDADGFPQVPELQLSEPVFIDADGSGDAAALSGVTLRHGYTTTESWSIEYDGERWWVTGSRSGKQGQPASTDTQWESDEAELTFTVEGTATLGDRIELATHAGVVEHDLGGTVMGLVAYPPSPEVILVGLWTETSAELVLWDADAASARGRISLPEGTQPWRIITDDETIWIGDSRQPVILELTIDPVAGTAASLTEISTDGPVTALAVVSDEGDEIVDEPAYRHLFVATTTSNRLDVYDLDAGTWLDANPLDGVTGGVDLRSPIIGLSATPQQIRLQQTSEFGARLEENVVLITLVDGSVAMAEGDSGCLAIDIAGPRIDTSQGVEVITFDDVGQTSDPEIYLDTSTGRYITMPTCGGVALSENWLLTYDGISGDWRVEGSTSGEQIGRAREDERYVSDDGAISFLILSGTQPSSDGDALTFAVNDGTLRITGIESSAGTDPLELPAAPVVFAMEAGPTGGGWDEDHTQIHAIVPLTASDLVLRIRPQAWEVQVVWQ